MGKRLLFLTTWDFSDGPSTGITKKIKSQIKVFLKQGYEVDYILVIIMSGFMRKELYIRLEKRKLEENFQPICT